MKTMGRLGGVVVSLVVIAAGTTACSGSNDVSDEPGDGGAEDGQGSPDAAGDSPAAPDAVAEAGAVDTGTGTDGESPDAADAGGSDASFDAGLDGEGARDGTPPDATSDTGGGPTADTGADAGADMDTGADAGADAAADAEAAVDGAGADGGGDASSTADAAPSDAGTDTGAILDGASADAATDAPDGAPACALGALQCNGNTLQVCAAGGWVDQTVCAAFCAEGACQTPPSCSGLPASCGASNDVNCCSAHLVLGDTFERSYDYTMQYPYGYPATVSDFILDDFEVTVGRFGDFVAAYPAVDGGAGNIPSAGSGKNPNDPSDTGWDSSWPLPANRAALEASLTSCSGTTWATGSVFPINCVDWYVAFAFCIWDGGRLPTEAEWNFAAAGGVAQLTFPWSTSFEDQSISAADAVFYPAAIAKVGSKLPLGVGPWLQADLVGNVSEWVRDSYEDPYTILSCDNCADYAGVGWNVYRGGDISFSGDTSMAASGRFEGQPNQAMSTVGIRCAR